MQVRNRHGSTKDLAELGHSHMRIGPLELVRIYVDLISTMFDFFRWREWLRDSVDELHRGGTFMRPWWPSLCMPLVG